jgi:hypothetical protein
VSRRIRDSIILNCIYEDQISHPGILAQSSTNLDTSNAPLDNIFLSLGCLHLSQTKATRKSFVAHMFQKVILSLEDPDTLLRNFQKSMEKTYKRTLPLLRVYLLVFPNPYL